jgi:hypothetical protein
MKYRTAILRYTVMKATRLGEKVRTKAQKLKVGEWMEVRCKTEILKTLDGKGQLDGMPFMPEMFAFCGKQFQVRKRAHKTCDTVFPVRSRRLDRAVHLETRCDGSAHGGCQAGCLIFWKVAWLKPVMPNSGTSSIEGEFVPNSASFIAQFDDSAIIKSTQMFNSECGPLTYSCQATQLPYATTNLDWWDVRQYVQDYMSGNVGIRRLVSGLIYSMFYSLSQVGIGVGPAMRRLYDRFCPLWHGTKFPRKAGMIPVGRPTPMVDLNLQPGEIVRVKSHEEILGTLNTSSMNRGLLWDAEMVPYCGGTYRVLKRVTQIINEKTGCIQTLKNPCIILDSVVCQARYSKCRIFCPRSIYLYWREIWLERTYDSPTKILSNPTLGES